MGITIRPKSFLLTQMEFGGAVGITGEEAL